MLLTSSHGSVDSSAPRACRWRGSRTWHELGSRATARTQWSQTYPCHHVARDVSGMIQPNADALTSLHNLCKQSYLVQFCSLQFCSAVLPPVCAAGRSPIGPHSQNCPCKGEWTRHQHLKPSARMQKARWPDHRSARRSSSFSTSALARSKCSLAQSRRSTRRAAAAASSVRGVWLLTAGPQFLLCRQGLSPEGLTCVTDQSEFYFCISFKKHLLTINNCCWYPCTCAKCTDFPCGALVRHMCCPTAAILCGGCAHILSTT